MSDKILGRGLSSLLKENVRLIAPERAANMVDINLIYVNPSQPRKFFNQSILQELAQSITIHGILQPILVKKDDEKYQIIAGERRYRAAKLAGLKKIPVIIKNIAEREILEIALIENIQREALNPIEEAQTYEKLIKDFNYTQSEIATTLAKSRSHIANIIRLNQLPATIQEMLMTGLLSMGQARCLIGRQDAEKLAKKIIEKKLNVRDTEKLIAEQENQSNLNHKARQISPVRKKRLINTSSERKKNEDLALLTEVLSKKMGVKVIVENIDDGGRISIYYDSLEELDLILTKLD